MTLHRPWFRWLLFALCVGLFVAAMAWVTHRMMGMDRQRDASEREAQVQEKMRLALWRMDSLVSTLLIRENSRPPGHYQAFHSPEDLFSNRSQRELPKGEAVMPSPLLGEPPEFVHLHFQMLNANGTTVCTSPQVPTGKDLSLANNWYVISPQLEAAKQQLDKLNAMVKRHPNVLATTEVEHKALSPAPAASPPPAPMSAAAPVPSKAMMAPEPKTEAKPKLDEAQSVANRNELQQRVMVTAGNVTLNGGKLSVEELPKKKLADSTSRSRSPLPPPSAVAVSRSAVPASPADVMKAEKSLAATSVGAFKGADRETSATGKTMTKNAQADDAKAKSQAAPADQVMFGTSKASTYIGGTTINAGTLSPAQAPAASGYVGSPGTSNQTAQAEARRAMGKDGVVALDMVKDLALPAEQPSTSALPEDLKPRWLEDELLLVRHATVDGGVRLQGLWLDWPKLRARLLDTIKDLLPNAELSPTDPAWLDATSMVALPVRLLPGRVELAMSDPSPLRRSLIIAWACFLIAATAVGIVLNRAMLLSERRGAFVSAVTHELRTPLTTFQLYSEMLADDMVPDAEKRREYLRTLCDESTRLTHLVENVLSYSRIERGRASARRETLLLSDLIARIEPRLRQRTQPTGLDLRVVAASEAAETQVHVDALAVEQIVFNLVDNACKYAAPASKEKTLLVEVAVESRQVVIRVRDHGPGLSKEQLKRLFRPFEKSATEAAHSAPGVGLGLALCRRLARELGGDLVLESSDAGACFKFTMPR